jgi:hypothetical protein
MTKQKTKALFVFVDKLKKKRRRDSICKHEFQQVFHMFDIVQNNTI